MITFVENFLQSASVNSSYSALINVIGGTAPYAFAITSGVLPPGLTMSAAGLISGQAQTLGTYAFTVNVADSTTPTAQTASKSYTLTVLDLVTLTDVTVDQEQFVAQFQEKLSVSNTWSAGLTTQTSQTLIEYISAVGTLMTAKIVRAVEDAFPETAQSDSAIRAIVNMQGLRLSRKLPAAMEITATSTIALTIPPFTQWSSGGLNWFNSQPVVFQPNIPQTVTLKEGLVVVNQVTGLGKDLQAWISPDDQFSVSDQDVVVNMNGQDLFKSFGPLWNYPGLRAFTDMTLSDGRLAVQFGAQGYGAVPGVNDVVTITYAKTQGATVNGANLSGARVVSNTFSTVTATVVSNPSGGADTKPTVAYKNFAAGSFGTYSSGVTKAQYSSLVNNYPGIVDAFTQAQREINPALLKWMNVIRVSALTTSTWTQQQVNDFLNYMQSVTMYTPKFIWQEAVAILNDVELEVYCFNSVNSLSDVENACSKAVTNLFAPRAGILMTDFFESDLEQTCFNAAPGQISYVLVKKPTQSMIVTAPLSPRLIYQIVPSGGSLSPLLYSYAVSVDAPSPSQWLQGLIDASTNPPNPTATEIGQYWVIKVAGTVGSVAVAVGDQLLATSLSTFTVVPAASNGVLDIGVPTNWVNPEVTVSGSQVILDWSANPTQNALTYHIWGRRGGFIGILASVAYNVLTYTDPGGADPTPVAVGAASDTLIRYNKLNTLKVTAFYANRQTKVLLPVRDSLT